MLTQQERERLTLWKAQYVAQHHYCVTPEVAKRLVFWRWLVATRRTQHWG